jgi:hypothetical protein
MASIPHRPIPPITADDFAKASAPAARLLGVLVGSAVRVVTGAKVGPKGGGQ